MEAPRDFRYWERIDRSWPRRVRAIGRAILGFDLAPPDDVVHRFAAMYFDGDPAADALLAEPSGRAQLERAIEGEIPLPFEELRTTPAWLEPAKVELGARCELHNLAVIGPGASVGEGNVLDHGLRIGAGQRIPPEALRFT